MSTQSKVARYAASPKYATALTVAETGVFVTCPSSSAQWSLEGWLSIRKEEPIRKCRFTEEQMVEILHEAEETSVAAAAKMNKGSEHTICSWRQHFAGLEPNDVKKMTALEAESAKLKKLLAERDFAIDAMKEVVRHKW